MTNQELNEKLKSKAAQERTLTKEILWDIVEVEKRKLYLDYAYPSLFAYLTEYIGYSEGAAQRRIDAARLLAKVPEVSHAIENGTINLAQVSKMQKICRQIKKDSGAAVQVILQKSVLKKLENKNAVQTDLILAQEFNVRIEVADKKKIQQDESVRIELTFTKDEMHLIETARALLSNKTGGTLKATFIAMAEKMVKDAQPKTGASQVKKATRAATAAVNIVNAEIEVKPRQSATATVAVKPPDVAIKTASLVGPIALRSVTPRLKREIRERDQVCQFKNPKTGKRCGSRFFLEVDHVQPRFLNGPNTIENLRMLCKSHNIFRYEHGL